MAPPCLTITKVVAFYTTLVRNLAAQGRLEWHVVRVGDRAVAAEMGVRCGVSLMLPKYAFDEDFADCMPAILDRGGDQVCVFVPFRA